MATTVRMPNGEIRETSDIEELKRLVGDPSAKQLQPGTTNPMSRGQQGTIVGGEFPNEFKAMASSEAQSGARGPGSVNDGRPEIPKYADLLTAGDKPGLASNYLLQARPDIAYEGVGLNTQAMEALRQRGLSTEQSPWEKMARQQQSLEEQGLIGRTRQGGQRRLAETFSSLASRGGLSRSARQRLARQGMESGAIDEQGVRSGGLAARLGIGQAGEEQRLGILKALPGMELGVSGFGQSEAARKAAQAAENRQYATGVEQRNLDETLKQIRLQDAAKYGNYKEQMAGWAAGKQAAATEASGK